MNETMFKEVRQLSAEMKEIVSKSEQEHRKMTKDEQEALDQLIVAREALVSDIIFHGYI